MTKNLPDTLHKGLRISLAFLVLTSFWIFNPIQTEAAILTNSQVQLSNSIPSQTGVTYTASFLAQQGTAKCIVVQFATNADMTGGAPSGMTTTSYQKGAVSGTTVTDGNWSVYTSAANGTLQFENSTGDTLTGGTWATASATTITNPSITTFYAQVTTYSTLSTHTCGGTAYSSNVIALQTIAGVATSVTVAPTLSVNVANYGSAVNGSGDSSPITTTSTTVPFGTVAAGSTAWGSQTVTVSTNAANGYRLYVGDTGTMTNANSDTFRDQTGTPASTNTFDGSTSQSSFAYTADGNGVAFGSDKWAGLGNSQTQYLVALRTASINSDATHVEYKVQPSNTQPPGTYSTTVVYTAVPSY